MKVESQKSKVERLIIGLCSVLCILYSPKAHATTYNSAGATTEQEVQLRVAAEFTKKWRPGVQLTLSEELRSFHNSNKIVFEIFFIFYFPIYIHF